MSPLRWIVATVSFALAYHAVQLLALVVRFEALPNFVTLHDWPGNVARILRSTPALTDVPASVADEWLLEIGSFNRSFGKGITEWSLAVLPAKLAAALLAAAVPLLRAAPPGTCRRAGAAATGIGTALAALTGITVSWVVCCAAPSWVVGLAVLGLGVTTSFALLPWGPWLAAAGFGLLLAGVLLPVWSLRRGGSPPDKG